MVWTSIIEIDGNMLIPEILSHIVAGNIIFRPFYKILKNGHFLAQNCIFLPKIQIFISFLFQNNEKKLKKSFLRIKKQTINKFKHFLNDFRLSMQHEIHSEYHIFDFFGKKMQF